MASAELEALLTRYFPGACVQPAEGGFALITIHGVGPTEDDAKETAVHAYKVMREDGTMLPQLLQDVRAMLTEWGMSRERHDSIQELLTIADSALNAGVLTGVVPWIMVPSYTREIEELRRRTATRLNMVAQELSQREKAAKRATQHFPRSQPNADIPRDDRRTPYERLKQKFGLT